MKNLEELKNKDRIQEIQGTTKIIKRKRQPKHIKKKFSSLRHSEKAQYKRLPNAIMNNAKYVMYL